ncbi:MAG: hypothetical protein ABIG84_04850 [archaeon]
MTFTINAWTINQLDDIKKMLGLNVDIISSDRPDAVLNFIRNIT